MTPYFHGGSRVVGDVIYPQEADRTRSGDPDGFVYVTTDQHLATTYAATTDDPWVYEVRPIGKVEPDPGSSLPYSFRCPGAEIIRRLKPSNREVEYRRRVVFGLDALLGTDNRAPSEGAISPAIGSSSERGPVR